MHEKLAPTSVVKHYSLLNEDKIIQSMKTIFGNIQNKVTQPRIIEVTEKKLCTRN